MAAADRRHLDDLALDELDPRRPRRGCRSRPCGDTRSSVKRRRRRAIAMPSSFSAIPPHLQRPVNAESSIHQTIIGVLTPAPDCRSLRGPGRVSMADVRELTYGEAVREAIAEEMRRDPRVFLIGEDVAEAGHPVQDAGRAGAGVRHRADHRHADLRARLRGHRRGRGDDRHAADRRRDVRRLHHADHGPDGQPGRQGALHVGRQDQGADRLPHHARAPPAARPPSTRSRSTPG